MRWSENQTFEFVKLYFRYEYLWNTEHEDYKLKDRRLKAYRDIVSEFKTLTGISLSIGELKAKIKNLRSTYSQELNKIKCRSGPDYTYEPTIKWFAYWHKRFQQLRVPKTHDSLATFEVLFIVTLFFRKNCLILVCVHINIHVQNLFWILLCLF